MNITFRNLQPGIGSFIPTISLRLGSLGWGCWYFANLLVGPSPTHQLSAPSFQPVIKLSKAIIYNPVANNVLHHGSLVCFLGGAGVIGLRHVALLWDTYRDKDEAG